VGSLKVECFCEQEPAPLNTLFDASRPTPAYQAFKRHGPYNYAFNRGGIHFAVIDSNVVPPKPTWTPERIAGQQPRWEMNHRWLVDNFCRQAGNPERLPALVFLHHPEYASGDRGMEARPLYRVLADCPDQHTVKAVFGGHYHSGQYWPPEDNAGAHVYATPASVHTDNRPVEFIVADVHEDRIVFVPHDSISGQPRLAPEPVHYRPLLGRFGDLRQPKSMPAPVE
jgi:hypothetical protein